MAEITINVEKMTDFLVGLLNTPSPSGYTIEAIAYVESHFAALSISNLQLMTTPKGALVAHWQGQKSDAPRGVTAHVDTLGLMVKEIKGSGRLKTTQLGGFMWNAVEFEGVTVRTNENKRYRGTCVPSNASVHVNRDIGEAKRSGDLMEIRLDVKTTNAAETRALGINVGDFVFLDARVEVTDTGFIRSRHLDDKASVAAIYGALMALKEAGLKPAQDTTFLISNFEEVGHGARYGLPDNLDEMLAVDMGAIGDGQATDEYTVSLCVKDSGGPYQFEMNNKLRLLAEQYGIPYKLDIYPYYGSDGTAYWGAGGRAKVGLIGPGVDASHAYERTHKDSLQHTTHLVARYLVSD